MHRQGELLELRVGVESDNNSSAFRLNTFENAARLLHIICAASFDVAKVMWSVISKTMKRNVRCNKHRREFSRLMCVYMFKSRKLSLVLIGQYGKKNENRL